jgi:Ca2+:H+ antiporter
MNLLMLLMALLCHLLPMLFQYGGASVAFDADSSLQFSRAASIVMVIAYFAYLIFQLWTHRQLFEAQDVCFVLFNFEMVKLIVNFIYVLW